MINKIKEGKRLVNVRKSRQVTILVTKTFSVREREQRELLQSELDDFYTEKAKGAFIRSRARWIEKGGKFFIFL